MPEAGSEAPGGDSAAAASRSGRCRRTLSAVRCMLPQGVVLGSVSGLGAGTPVCPGGEKGRNGVEAAIVFVLEDGKTREIPLKPHTYLVGRHTDCQLRLPEASVSRQHARIDFDGASITVEDLGSSNGTYVNREKVESQQTLSAGDAISIGTTVLLVRIDGEPGDFDAGEIWQSAQAVLASASPAGHEPKTVLIQPDAFAGAPTGPAAVPAEDPSDLSGSDIDLGPVPGDDSGSGDQPFGGGLLGGDANDGSSFGDFDLDLLTDDDDDDQPSL